MSMIPDICSMYILLAAATTFEIQPTIDLLGPKDRETASSGGDGTGVLITGIGSVATSWSLMRQIGSRKPDLIIQAGIAGCFSPAQTGKVVAIREEIPADLGVWEDETFRTVFDMRLVGRDEAPFTDGLLVNPYKDLLDLTTLEQVRAITVNEITTEKKRIGWYQQNMVPFVESMEGAALHYVCLQEQIPFLQLRAVSNDIGVRDKKKWDIPGAIANLNARLIAIVDKLGPINQSIIRRGPAGTAS